MRRIATASNVLLLASAGILLGTAACTDTLVGPTSLQEEIAPPATVRSADIDLTSMIVNLSPSVLEATLYAGETVTEEKQLTLIPPPPTFPPTFPPTPPPSIGLLTMQLCSGDEAYAGWLQSVTPAARTNVLLPANVGFSIVVGPPEGTGEGTYGFGICAVGDGAELARQDVTIVVEVEMPTTIEATIDIKPGSDPNSINLGSKGKGNGKTAGPNAKIAVALFSTADFDATLVDVSTVTLGDLDGSDTQVVMKNNGTYQASAEDVNDDGLLDMVFHFSRAELIDNGDLTEDSDGLYLTGTHVDGDIEGWDAVSVIH